MLLSLFLSLYVFVSRSCVQLDVAREFDITCPGRNDELNCRKTTTADKKGMHREVGDLNGKTIIDRKGWRVVREGAICLNCVIGNWQTEASVFGGDKSVPYKRGSH